MGADRLHLRHTRSQWPEQLSGFVKGKVVGCNSACSSDKQKVEFCGGGRFEFIKNNLKDNHDIFVKDHSFIFVNSNM